MDNRYDEALAGSCLTWGIVALVCSSTGLLGLIFAIVAKSRVKKFKESGATLVGKAKVGSILSTVALILSIIAIVYFVAYFGIVAFSLSSYIDKANAIR